MATPSRPGCESSEAAAPSASGRPATRSGSKKKKTTKAAPKKKNPRQPTMPAPDAAPDAAPPVFQGAPTLLPAPLPAPEATPAEPDMAAVEPGAREIVPTSEPAPEANHAVPAEAPPETPAAPVRPPYDVTDFLTGVFEDLPGASGLSLDCHVDPRADTLAVERLLYFSQALHLLFAALRSPDCPAIRDPGDHEPLCLRIRLDIGPGERTGLRLYDDGRTLARMLPETHLDQEALRPLRLFVSRKGGSICLRRGRCLEFEIIG